MQFFEKLKAFDIILASQSPRRHNLLELTGIPFRVLAKPTSENFPKNLEPPDVAMMLARQKAMAFTAELSNQRLIVIAADTIVVAGGKIVNKPSGYNQAVQMLERLSGQKHKVITGVCICHQDQIRLFCETTYVYFRVLTPEEIQYYVTHFKPYDKAGGYGIQEWIGHVGIQRIEGSYPNVVGLPIERVFSELMALTQS